MFSLHPQGDLSAIGFPGRRLMMTKWKKQQCLGARCCTMMSAIVAMNNECAGFAQSHSESSWLMDMCAL